MVEPKRDSPYTDKQLPSLARLLSEMQLPRVTKSSTENALPRRPTP
jgi:hypothetical protein